MKNQQLPYPIILIGMRGVGKTTLGMSLAQHLDYSFVDIDAQIEQDIDTDIKSFVDQYGFDTFRDRENQVFIDILKNKNPKIIATGGGIIEIKSNRDILQDQPYVIHIQTDINDVIRYLEEDTTRPALTDKTIRQEVEDVWNQRQPLYQSCAKYTFQYDQSDGSFDLIQSNFCQFVDSRILLNNQY